MASSYAAGVAPGARPQIVPYLYYRDAGAALDFLVGGFGFTEVSAVRDEDGSVWTSTIRLGDGLVMVGPGLEGFGTAAVPEGSLATSRLFVLVDDVEGHHARAAAAGATIVSPPAEHGGGHRQYVARDPGGHEWIFAQPSSRRSP